MAKEKILVVDDEEDILELLKYNLIKEGYRVACVKAGEQAISIAKLHLPDLIVLDLMLPGVDGLEVCRLLKNDVKTANIPIVMLTAKGEDSDIIVGLEMGADDYVTKPFSPKVLLARIRAVLRRKKREFLKDKNILKIGEFLIDKTRYEVKIKDKPVPLTIEEFKLLHLLASQPGRVFTRSQIIDLIKGEDYVITERAVDVQIHSLRRKIGSASKLIETVRGIGYRFKG